MANNFNSVIQEMVDNLKPVTFKPLISDEILFTAAQKRSASLMSNDSTRSSSEGCTDVESSASKKPKLIHNVQKFDLSYVGSPREMRRLRADIIEARNTILKLESNIQTMHSVRREMEIMFDNERETLKRQHEYDSKSIGELENVLQQIRKRETDSLNKLEDANAKYLELKLTTEAKMQEMENQIAELKERSQCLDQSQIHEATEFTRKIDELEVQIAFLKDENDAHKDLVADLQKQLNEKNELERKLEMKDHDLQAARLKLRDLQYVKDNYQEYQEQSKNHIAKLARLGELEKQHQRLQEENTRLKEEVLNKLILEEEVHDLRTRLKHFQEQKTKFTQLQVEHEKCEKELCDWRTVAGCICETGSETVDAVLPYLLRTTVERLQHQEIQLTSAKVELESDLSFTRHDLQMAQAEVTKLTSHVVELKRTNEQKHMLLRRMQKKVELVTRERDSYRLQLDSYEKDLTINNINSSVAAGECQMLRQQERIENLEKMLSSYREMISKLETDLQEAHPQLYNEPLPAHEDQVRRIKQEMEQLVVENEHLRSKNDHLQIQLEQLATSTPAKSEFIPNTNADPKHIYHMVQNPLASCIAERERMVETLQQEVERLRRKLKKTEEFSTSSSTSVLTAVEESQKLQDEVKTLKAQQERIKELARSRMHELRDVIYQGLGYKVDRTSDSIYKLTSVYAERENDTLCFQMKRNGTLDLLGTEYSERLEELVNLHLRQHDSIPMFLSSLTIDLFNSRTVTMIKSP